MEIQTTLMDAMVRLRLARDAWGILIGAEKEVPRPGSAQLKFWSSLILRFEIVY